MGTPASCIPSSAPTPSPNNKPSEEQFELLLKKSKETSRLARNTRDAPHMEDQPRANAEPDLPFTLSSSKGR